MSPKIMAPLSNLSLTFGGKNAFSFCRSNNGTIQDNFLFSFTLMFLKDFQVWNHFYEFKKQFTKGTIS